ncbi:CHAP domain-containing protein [Flavobacterium ardleyense]|uniref:CHAP domain-containing protein n=1 Tax=Flavobacterium ardleyense TaxID=2038737 RepID=A0ABW5Z5X2_9FLAO
MNYPNRTIKKGEKDATIVVEVQKMLNKRGIVKVTINGVFDELMKSSVKLFQSMTTDVYGNLLIADGVIGPITWGALFENEKIKVEKTSKSLLEAALEIATSQIGVLEQPLGSNAGPEVEKYLASVRSSKGNPWCMAFVYYCFQEASKTLKTTNPLIRTGGCLSQWNRTIAKKITASTAQSNPSFVIPGSIFIIDHGSGLGHTGIVKEVNNGYITTIEGNTNNKKSREGIGVFLLQSRKLNSINKGFIVCS